MQSEAFYPGDLANNKGLGAAHRHVVMNYGRLKNVFIKKQCSFDAAQEYPDKFFDLVFIDAIHTLPMCLADCVAWWPKVKPGGWLTGHDYNLGEMPGCPALSVNAALQQFLFLLHRSKLDIVTYEQDSWGIHKCA